MKVNKSIYHCKLGLYKQRNIWCDIIVCVWENSFAFVNVKAAISSPQKRGFPWQSIFCCCFEWFIVFEHREAKKYILYNQTEVKMFLHDSVTIKGFCWVKFTHLVCLRGMGREMHRKGSNVLLCLRQCGHVRDDLEIKNEKKRKQDG